jgi:hypothetical protein
MLFYGNYMRSTRLKWKGLFFTYTLSCFDPLFKDANFNLVPKWAPFAQQDVHDDTNIPCIKF